MHHERLRLTRWRRSPQPVGRAVVRGAGTHSLSAGAGAWPRVTTARAISERHLSYEALRSLRPEASCQGRSSSPGNCAHVSRWQRGPDVSGRSVGGCRSDRPEPQTAPSEALPQATMPKPQSTESTDAARASCRGQHVSAGMMVAAWSSRATPPRPCRHPFTWDEVATKIDVTSFTVPDVVRAARCLFGRARSTPALRSCSGALRDKEIKLEAISPRAGTPPSPRRRVGLDA